MYTLSDVALARSKFFKVGSYYSRLNKTYQICHIFFEGAYHLTFALGVALDILVAF